MTFKLLQIYKVSPYHVGGVEFAMKTIIESLPTWKHGVLYAGKPDNIKKTPSNVTLHTSFTFGNFWSMPMAPLFLWDMGKVIKQYDMIILHAPFPFNDIYFGLNHVIKATSKPYIVFWHSDVIKQDVIQRLYKKLTIHMLNHAKGIWTTNPILPKQSSILSSIYQLQPTKFQTISQWFNIKHFASLNQNQQQQSQQYKKKYGPYILNVGRLVTYKGQEYLIRAMQQVHEKYKLIITGQGPLKNSLQSLVKKLGLSSRVFFISADDTQIISLYNGADFFILPSISTAEAFGRVQVEAMASQKAIINTQLNNGVNWVARHNKEALTVPLLLQTQKDKKQFVEGLTNTINMLIDQPQLKHTLAHHGKIRSTLLFNSDDLPTILQNLLS